MLRRRDPVPYAELMVRHRLLTSKAATMLVDVLWQLRREVDAKDRATPRQRARQRAETKLGPRRRANGVSDAVAAMLTGAAADG